MARTVKEWIAKHDDQRVPASVRQRIYDRENGVCYLCSLPIDGKGFEADHKEELKDGGEHREGNLYPVHPKCHKLKTARKAAERVKSERTKQKHSGARRPKGEIQSAPFAKAEKKKAGVDKSPLPPLPRRSLYQEM